MRFEVTVHKPASSNLLGLYGECLRGWLFFCRDLGFFMD